MRERFDGEIFGIGSKSGIRVVIGNWSVSRFGPFADAMVETPDGHRTLIAPTQEIADYVAETYNFDTVAVMGIDVQREQSRMRFGSESLQLDVSIGQRTALGLLLRCVPAKVSSAPWWATTIDPIVRVVMRGVRTTGRANQHRREWYGASDIRAVTYVEGTFDGEPLGDLRPIDPPVRFGFASTPARPSVVTVTSTIEARRP